LLLKSCRRTWKLDGRQFWHGCKDGWRVVGYGPYRSPRVSVSLSVQYYGLLDVGDRLPNIATRRKQKSRKSASWSVNVLAMN
jgi:hypothetical protein